MRKRRNFWTKDRCLRVSKKCESRREFQLNYPSAYDISYKKDWLNEMCNHMYFLRKPKQYWTIEKCVENLKKCSSRTEFQKKYPVAYRKLRINRLLEFYGKHLKRPKRKIIWCKKNCIKEAKKYYCKRDWIKKGKGSYNVASKNKWINECCTHMIRIGSRYKRLIYSFEFPDKSVYVGLTCDAKARKKEHLNPKRIKKSTVFQYIEKTKQQPFFKELTDYIDTAIASKKEGEFLNKYKNNGWKILNKRKCGEIGGSILKWDKKNCMKEALKYDTRSKFQRGSSSAYASAKRNEWFFEITKHMKLIRKRK